MFNLFKKKSSYLCVLHFRRQNARRRASDPPFVESYAVAYNGKIKNNFCECTDDGETVNISIDGNDISLVFPAYTKSDAIKIPYKQDEICRYHVPIMDAMESWEFIVSNKPINHQKYKTGFERGLGEVYYNIKNIDNAIEVLQPLVDSFLKEKAKKEPEKELPEEKNKNDLFKELIDNSSDSKPLFVCVLVKQPVSLQHNEQSDLPNETEENHYSVIFNDIIHDNSFIFSLGEEKICCDINTENIEIKRYDNEFDYLFNYLDSCLVEKKTIPYAINHLNFCTLSEGNLPPVEFVFIVSVNHPVDISEAIMFREAELPELCKSSGCTMYLSSEDKKLPGEGTKVTVGGEPYSDILLESTFISHFHAEFTYNEDTWLIKDTSSKNGTWLNGEKLIPDLSYEITSGDKIKFYNQEFIFHSCLGEATE